MVLSQEFAFIAITLSNDLAESEGEVDAERIAHELKEFDVECEPEDGFVTLIEALIDKKRVTSPA